MASWAQRSIKRKTGQQFAVSFSDEPIFVKPISALRVTAIENQFPVDPDTGRMLNPTAWMAAILIEIVHDADYSPAFTKEEMDVLDADHFYELWNVAATYVGIKKPSREKVFAGLWNLAEKHFATRSKDDAAGDLWDAAKAYILAADRKN